MKYAKILLCLLLAAALPLTGCRKQAADSTTVGGTAATMPLTTNQKGEAQLTDPGSQSAEAIQPEYSDFDRDAGSDDLTATVNLLGDTAEIAGRGAAVVGDSLQITAGGSYLLQGDWQGQILVKVPADEKVQLVLAGCSITYAKASPILCEQADKLAITLRAGTENTVIDQGSGYIDSAEGEDDPNTRTAGAIHAKCALTINGSGSLTVQADYHNGIHTKKTLKIMDGNIQVEAADDGVKGKNAVVIQGGSLTVNAGEDGIQCSETENTQQGYIWIEGGKVSITAQGDGIDASLYLLQKGGEVTVNAIGTARKEGTSQGGGMYRPGMGGSSQDGYETNSDGYYKIDPKGVKAGATISLTGGTMTVHSTGHALQSKGSLTVGGEMDLRVKAYCEAFRANSKGLTAEGDLLVSGGSVTVEYCYEGLESANGAVYITGGSVRVEYAVDDGFNASAGGSMMGGGMMPPGMGGWDQPAEEESTDSDRTTGIFFTGGYTYVNAFGDGLDSNGDIAISGGTVIVAGPTNGGNGALDCGDNRNTVSVTGGILVAYGSSGMAEAPDASVTTQCSIAYSAGLQAGGTLAIVDSKGDPVIALQIADGNIGQHVVISCPGLVQGESYTLRTGVKIEGTAADGLWDSPTAVTGGTVLTTLTLSSVVTGSSGMGGGMGGGGNRPGRPW